MHENLEKLDGKHFNLMELLISVLFVALSVCMFVDPQFLMVVVIIVLVLTALIRGGTRILFFFRYRTERPLNAWISFFAGIMNVLLGIVLLFNVRGGIFATGILFALWFFADALGNLINYQSVSPYGRAYLLLHIICNVAGIVLGVFLLLNPISSATIVAYISAAYFLISGIGGITLSFHRFANPQQARVE